MLKIWTVNDDYEEYDLSLYTLVLDDNWITISHSTWGITMYPWDNIVRIWHSDPEKLIAAVVT